MAKLFFSYSHADEDLRDQLEKQLVMLRREGLIENWHDRRIVAGDPIDHAIDQELASASIILLLVSPDFLASDYCYDVEVKAAMARHDANAARVIPIILRPCDWMSGAVPFCRLKALPRDGKPVSLWPDRDEAMLDIVKQLRVVLQSSAPAEPEKKTQLVSGARSEPATAAPIVSRPRSSNMRIAKKFTEADQDAFVDEAFEYMATYFENSLNELQARHEPIQIRFRRIDADSFGCVIYQHGKPVARCGIRRGGAFGNGISYSQNDAAPSNSMNEQLSVGFDDQSMWLRPMGFGFSRSVDEKSKLTHQGAADHYWSMLIEPLQR